MKRILGIAVTLAILMSMAVMPAAVQAADAVPTWDGTSDESWYNSTDTEFTITTPEQLAGLAQIVNRGDDTFQNKTIILANDMELFNGRYAWTPIGFYNPNGGETVRYFKGTFLGNGHSVGTLLLSFNYPISGNTSMYCSTYGLFGRVFGAKIDGVVADVYTNVPSSAYISWYQYIGGIVGDAWGNSQITNCYVTGEVIGGYNVGGICGNNTYAVIDHCYNAATVETRLNASNSNGYAGGISGSAEYGAIINSCNAGDVKGTGSANKVGGIVAGNGYDGAWQLTHSIENCYNMGNISTTNATIGGLVGSNGYSGVEGDLNHSVINSYTNGEITYDADTTGYAGDLIGHTFHGWAFKSYWLNPGVDVITGWDNVYWDGEAEGLGYFTSNSSTVENVNVTQSGVTDAGDSGKTLLAILNEEKTNHNSGNSVASNVSTARAYLPWTTSAANVNNGYPVFDYPITVKFKYEDEDDNAYRTDSSIAWASASAAAGDSVKVNIADSETLVSMRGGVHSPVDIGTYTNTEYDNDSMVKFTDEDTFTMPAFDTTIYVTLAKGEWISALVYDFPADTETEKNIMLVTGSNAADVQFNVTMSGAVTYVPEYKYLNQGEVTAGTYYNEGASGYDDTLRDSKITAETLGTKYLATMSFNVSTSDRTAGIVFQPQSGTRKGKKYSWAYPEKWLTEVTE